MRDNRAFTYLTGMQTPYSKELKIVWWPKAIIFFRLFVFRRHLGLSSVYSREIPSGTFEKSNMAVKVVQCQHTNSYNLMAMR